jgi:DnaA family protein
MQQLLLDVFTPPKPNLGNFLVGRNAQVMHELSRLGQPGASSPQLVYLYGPVGCGKTHLLRGLAQNLGVTALTGTTRFVFKPAPQALLMDNIEELTPYSQVQLFNAFNSALADRQPPAIVLCGEQAPADLPLREDLRTRIQAGLCLRILPLTDDEKLTALQHIAQARGLELSPEVVDYALRHFQRDMGSLTAVMDGLDRFSLEQHKPVSVNLLRHWMKRRESLVVREPEMP